MSDPEEADAFAAAQQRQPAFAEPAAATISLQERDPQTDASTHLILPISAPAILADPLINSTYLEKYLIEGHLGVGGMSVVYKARHLFTNKIWAIKMLRLDPHFESPLHQRFVQEAQALSVLNHPNIIHVTDFGYDNEQRAYMVMEYVEGQALDDVYKDRGRLEQRQALIIFRQVCSALAHAHAKGVIHRDLKPANILLITDEQGNLVIKIVDFGIAKMADKSMTQSGAVFGSPLYMSPEQCEGTNVDARCDIYSLGCVFYEGLTGERTVDGDSIPGLLFKHVLKPPKTFAQVNEDLIIDRELECLVMQALAKKPEDRIQSMAEFEEQLNWLYQRLYDLDGTTTPVVNSPRLADKPNTPAQAQAMLTDISSLLAVLVALTLITPLSIIYLSGFNPVLTISFLIDLMYFLPLALAAARGLENPAIVTGLNLIGLKLLTVTAGGAVLSFAGSLALACRRRVSQNPIKTNISLGSGLALLLPVYFITDTILSHRFTLTHAAYSLFHFQLLLSLQWGGTLYQINRDLIKRGSTTALVPWQALLAGIFSSGVGPFVVAAFAVVAGSAATKFNLTSDLTSILTACVVSAYLTIAGVLNYRLGQAMDLGDPESGHPVLRRISPGIGFLLLMMGTMFTGDMLLLFVLTILQGLAFWWAYQQSAKLLKVKLKPANEKTSKPIAKKNEALD